MGVQLGDGIHVTPLSTQSTVGIKMEYIITPFIVVWLYINQTTTLLCVGESMLIRKEDHFLTFGTLEKFRICQIYLE